MPKSKYKRPGYKSCGKMVYNDASKALKIAKGVAALLNVEFYHQDVTRTASAITQTMVIDQLTNLSQGDTNITRTGDQVKYTSLEIKGILTLHASATTSQIRFLIVKDKQTNGAQFTAGQLLHDVTANDILVSPRNLDNSHRFVIMHDQMFSLSASGRQSINFYKKLHMNLRIRYGTNAGDITDLNSDSLFTIFIANEATNTPTVTHFTRLRFIDN